MARHLGGLWLPGGPFPAGNGTRAPRETICLVRDGSGQACCWGPAGQPSFNCTWLRTTRAVAVGGTEGDLAEHREWGAKQGTAAGGEIQLPIPRRDVGHKPVSNPCTKVTQVWAEMKGNEGISCPDITDYARGHRWAEGRGGGGDGVRVGKTSSCLGAWMGICGEAGEHRPREVGDGGRVSPEMGDKRGWLGATLLPCTQRLCLQPGTVSPPKLGYED